VIVPNRFCELVGCRVPVQLAPMSGVGTVSLAVAVAKAGGMGMLPMGGDLPVSERLRGALERAGSDGPIGVNVMMPFLDLDAVETMGALARLVEGSYGEPDDEVVALARAGGALVGWQVGSVGEAVRAVDAGCDLVVAQGVEAGGHLCGVSPVLELVAEVRAAVDVPVVAAGGIADGPAAARAVEAGADAVRVGTRFVTATESSAHPEYVEALLAAGMHDTVVTTAFGVGWSDAPHRVLRSALDAAEAFDGDLVGERVRYGGPLAVARFGASAPDVHTGGFVDAMALYAGTGVGSVRRVEPAARIVAELGRAIAGARSVGQVSPRPTGTVQG
jgi:nitronate monooxygenase